MVSEFEPTPGAKMMYLIRRRAGVTREELIAHWFANHMPGVIKGQHDAATAGRPHARRYIATLFDAGDRLDAAWDGVAQLWWDAPLPRTKTPIGTKPRDTFQQKAQPCGGGATTEYVVLDGSDELPVQPLTLNAPFPCTRSGFVKVTSLVRVKPNARHAELFEHWLGVHAGNARRLMREVGGFRYVVSLSNEPESEPYAGMAELYFPDADTWARFAAALQPDGMERWVDASEGHFFTSGTEMIGIP
jgi:EthD domain